MPAIDVLQQLTLPSVRKTMIDDLRIADKKWTLSGKKPAHLIVTDILKSI